MTDTNFDQPANVLWHATVPPTGKVEGGETRHFETLTQAIRFVMEGIPSNVRGTAWITTDSGSLTIDEIEGLYGELPPEAD